MRKNMITRTIKRTDVTMLCMDIANEEPCNRTVSVPGEFKTEKQLEKAAKELIEREANIKAVHVVDSNVVEQLYGMLEADFIAHAEPITRK